MDFEAPIDRHREAVRPEWIDYNGHMNVAYYVLVFDHGVDVFFDLLGVGQSYRADRDCSVFAVESHISYLREVAVDDPLRVTTQLLDHDEKRLHYFLAMYHARDGFLAATCETLSLHVDMAVKKAVPFPASVQDRIAAMMRAHGNMPRPDQVGRTIGIRRRA